LYVSQTFFTCSARHPAKEVTVAAKKTTRGHRGATLTARSGIDQKETVQSIDNGQWKKS